MTGAIPPVVVMTIPAEEVALWDWLGEGRVVFVVTHDVTRGVVLTVGTPHVVDEDVLEVGRALRRIDWTEVEERTFEPDDMVTVIRGGGPVG